MKTLIKITTLLIAAFGIRFLLMPFLEDENIYLRIASIVIVLIIGITFIIKQSANLIEETTEVLSKRTKLAGGLLQSLGTAFPDMVLGILAAIISLQLREVDLSQSVNFATIAAATTFGSNIYNIGFAIWCISRQNLANSINADVKMFPFMLKSKLISPMSKHKNLPTSSEIETAINVIIFLTLLTSLVAISMVLFGKVESTIFTDGDLYQLVTPIGLIVFIFSLLVLFKFRKATRVLSDDPEVINEGNRFSKLSSALILIILLLAGVSILLGAETMVHAIASFSQLTNLPYVISGTVTGLIGCLGEMLVIYNFSVHPKGKIGDAIVGVGMDNIVTILGASIVAIIGGIFLGGSALIIIFVIILCLNTVLIKQIISLQNYLQHSAKRTT